MWFLSSLILFSEKKKLQSCASEFSSPLKFNVPLLIEIISPNVLH